MLNIWGSKYQGVFTVASLERLDLWRPPLPPPLLPQHHTPSTTYPTTDLTPAPHFPPTSKFKITRITFGIAPRVRDLWGLASSHKNYFQQFTNKKNYRMFNRVTILKSKKVLLSNYSWFIKMILMNTTPQWSSDAQKVYSSHSA